MPDFNDKASSSSISSPKSTTGSIKNDYEISTSGDHSFVNDMPANQSGSQAKKAREAAVETVSIAISEAGSHDT